MERLKAATIQSLPTPAAHPNTASILFAAIRAFAGSTCAYVSMVTEEREWPSESETTRIGTPLANTKVA